jgi:hypothetical protein
MTRAAPNADLAELKFHRGPRPAAPPTGGRFAVGHPAALTMSILTGCGTVLFLLAT